MSSVSQRCGGIFCVSGNLCESLKTLVCMLMGSLRTDVRYIYACWFGNIVDENVCLGHSDVGRDRVVGIATCYGLDGTGMES
jgi:hypothetical protein